MDVEKKQWYHEFMSDEDKYNLELSGKMVLLVEILKECETIGDKIILFSQSLLTLDYIENLLEHLSSKSDDERIEDNRGTWAKGLDYFRMDGTTSADFRKSYIDMFNDPSNDRARLFLISTRAGSLGTNLVGANRVIIFDTSWNPSHDVQAIFRVYRFGQLKPVYIYRLLAQGTMEEKIYDRQVTKLSLSCRVVDEQQIDRHFSAADLAELYTFDPNSTTARPTPMVPKDRLLAELLIRKNNCIVTYHEHDSLLQNQTEEDLTEEERQAAWTEYENEREGKVAQANPDFGNLDFSKEPDFSQDYEGKILPNVTMIVTNIFEYLKKEMPSLIGTIEFKRKILNAVDAVRRTFQERHLKTLRLKQEYCTSGTVPNSINKYLDELSEAVKSSGDYITRLSQAIKTEETNLLQARMKAEQTRVRAEQARLKAQQASQRQQYLQSFQMRGGQMRGQMRAPTMFWRGSVPGTSVPSFISFLPQGQPTTVYVNTQNLQNIQKQKIQEQKSQEPKITEVDDSTPTLNTNSSNDPKSHSVTIEEIT